MSRSASLNHPRNLPNARTCGPSPNIRGSTRSRSSRPRSSGPSRPPNWSGARTGPRCSNGDAPFAKWFVGGKLNVSDNCLDRHLDGPRRNKAAIIWEGEPGERRILTYQQLHREVCRFANVLKRNGIKKGDRVLIYLPMIPEAAIAMLACARIGAVHSVVFGGFSSESINDRLADSGASIVITADGGYRRGQIVPLKQNVDEALARQPRPSRASSSSAAPTRSSHPGGPRRLVAPRGRLRDRRLSRGSPRQRAPALHPLHQRLDRQTQGHPAHHRRLPARTCTITSKYVFDLREEDIYWCTADVGWVTGHSYVVYGPLANGATTLMYEGAPNWPEPDRFWSIIDEYGVTILYTAPTAIRAFMKWGDEWPAKHDLSSLRLLGTVGEPINPEAWMWYQKHIGGERCPIVDTWWQTETGSI